MKKVKISREHRRALHAIWPPLIMAPLNRVVSDTRYYVRGGIWGDGLTPGEKAFVYKKIQEIEAIQKELADIYYKRLKR
jgi:hypothetical protein